MTEHTLRLAFDSYGNPAVVEDATDGRLRLRMLAGSDFGRVQFRNVETAHRVTNEQQIKWAEKRYAAWKNGV